MNDNSKKTVLVTGGAGGIGLCTAFEFARAGYRVIITDVDREALDRGEGELAEKGAVVKTYVVDVTKRAQVAELAETVIREFGGLDILINNAGIGYHGELAEMPIKKWKSLVDVNFWGALHHVYAFLPGMIEKRGGVIVNVSSGQAFFRLPTWGAYASIKAALGAFSEILHFELRKYGIHVTTVYPFMVNTPFYKDVQTDTLGGKLSMMLLPLYSQSPETVGRIIFKAAERRHRVEMVTVLNKLAFYGRLIPGFREIMSLSSNYLLAKKAA